MTHTTKNQWSDFYDNDPKLGPLLPLTSGQRVQLVSGVLPSGESALFDNRQLHSVRSEAPGFKGSGINAPFPYPNSSTKAEFAFVTGEDAALLPDKFSEDWWDASGILKTYPASASTLIDSQQQSGIFHWNSDEADVTQPSPEQVETEWAVPTNEDGSRKRSPNIKFYTQDEQLKGSIFSNGEQVKRIAREDFKIFNNYIHHQLMPDNEDPGKKVEIPFVSTYRVEIDWDIYG
jgi:hypothetical protein